MRLEDVPDLKRERFTERISVSITSETKLKLESIKKYKRKDTAELVRMLLDDFLKDIEFEGAG